jgi:hypothetical protein
MRGVVKALVFIGFLAAMSLAGTPRAAMATGHDGNWSVLIVTEKGTCDRAYRYAVRVANGSVRYTGDAKIDLSGTVSAEGLVRVNIRRGEQGANGSGHLSGQSGAGIWHGVGSKGTCGGRWEAERR